MISILKFSKSMRSIKSMLDVVNFRSDALEIPLTVIDSFADYETPKIESIGLGIGIYQGDNILSSYAISNMDRFFFKNGNSVLEIKAEEMPLYDKTKLYIQSRSIGMNLDNRTPVKISKIFGEDWRPDMSEVAWRRCIAIRVLEHLTKEMQPHAVCIDERLPDFERLVPWANFYEWIRLKYPTVANFFSSFDRSKPYAIPEIDITPEEFKHDRANRLIGKLLKLFPVIDEFVSENDDCSFHFEITGQSLFILRGIDHKYIPYYEAKFAGDDN